MKDLRNFDPKLLANSETLMWKYYYDHKFFKLFLELLRFFKIFFNSSFLKNLCLAYYSAKAAMIFRRVKKRNHDKDHEILINLEKYYTIINSLSSRRFDYQKAARLELNWWKIDRQNEGVVSSQRESAIASAMAVMMDTSEDKCMEYAKLRSEAMVYQDNLKISDKDGWDKIENLLFESYLNLNKEVNN